MKKTTPQKSSNRLAQYGALSLAIAGLTDANGQIIYTDVDPDAGGTSIQVDIDMDNDGNREFFIRQTGNELQVNAFNSLSSNANSVPGSIIGLDDNFNYPYALDSLYVISAGNTKWLSFSSIPSVLNFSNGCINPSYYSQWCSVQDKFLGLRFNIGGNTHYGWARLDVGTNTNQPGAWALKDFAYNDQAGQSIMAGEGMPLGLNDNAFSSVKIVALNKSVALFNLPQHTNYRLFSITGQSVLDGKISNNTHVIEANTLATGIYIIELEDAHSKEVIRKKIVL